MLKPFKISKKPLEFLNTLIECQLFKKLIFDQKHLLKYLYHIIHKFLLESSMIEITLRPINIQKCFMLNQKWIG